MERLTRWRFWRFSIGLATAGIALLWGIFGVLLVLRDEFAPTGSLASLRGAAIVNAAPGWAFGLAWFFGTVAIVLLALEGCYRNYNRQHEAMTKAAENDREKVALEIERLSAVWLARSILHHSQFAGERIRHDILDSDDSMSAELATREVDGWRQALINAATSTLTTAVAMQFNDPPDPPTKENAPAPPKCRATRDVKRRQLWVLNYYMKRLNVVLADLAAGRLHAQSLRDWALAPSPPYTGATQADGQLGAGPS